MNMNENYLPVEYKQTLYVRRCFSWSKQPSQWLDMLKNFLDLTIQNHVDESNARKAARSRQDYRQIFDWKCKKSFEEAFQLALKLEENIFDSSSKKVDIKMEVRGHFLSIFIQHITGILHNLQIQCEQQGKQQDSQLWGLKGEGSYDMRVEKMLSQHPCFKCGGKSLVLWKTKKMICYISAK